MDTDNKEFYILVQKVSLIMKRNKLVVNLMIILRTKVREFLILSFKWSIEEIVHF